MGDEHTVTGEKRAEGHDKRSVTQFGFDMLRKLRKNSHKAHWNTVTHWYLFGRLNEEVSELSKALNKRYSIQPTADRKELSQAIIDECADVANFAMMIADNERKNV